MGFPRDINRVSTVVREIDLIIPAVIRNENRARIFALGAFSFLFFYSVSNHYQFFNPVLLTMTWLDSWTPLIPWTVFVYMSEYFFIIVAYFFMTNDDTRNRYFWAFYFVLFTSVAVFIFYPTIYPRDLFPLPENGPRWILFPFETLRKYDTPANSFPSLHVSACFITAFSFLREARWKLYFFTFWATAVAVSTLTTKQHYILDVIGGLLLALCSAYIFIYKAKVSATRPINS